MKILIFGGGGYMGRALKRAYPKASAPPLDIADRNAVQRILESEKPDAVINAAGKTGRPNVDWCEEHKVETLKSNVIGPLVLLEECAKQGIYWVHISSGCMYEGDNGGKGFTEDDLPNFYGSFYACTKAWIDQVLRDFPVLQLRPRMPFDATTEDRNLIQKLKKYPKVLDCENSVTYFPDFLDALMQLVSMRATGIYNVTNPGTISPHTIMKMYKEIVDPAHTYERIALEGLPSVVKAGRSNCMLNTDKLRAEGIDLPPVEERMGQALEALAAGGKMKVEKY